MPMLGDLLGRAREGAGSFQLWLKVANPDLAAQVEQAASAEAITPTSYIRAAVSDFGRFASEEDWATLTSTLKSAEDPGTACLLAMVDWRLTASACPEHSHQNHSQEGAVHERSDTRSAREGPPQPSAEKHY
jgi:hypothetical protein